MRLDFAKAERMSGPKMRIAALRIGTAGREGLHSLHSHNGRASPSKLYATSFGLITIATNGPMDSTDFGRQWWQSVIMCKRSLLR